MVVSPLTNDHEALRQRIRAIQKPEGSTKLYDSVAFSLDEVFKYIRQTAPNVLVNRASLSGALRRLALNREIEMVSIGKSNKPSRYRPAP